MKTLLLALLGMYAISWLVTCGIIYLICLCFGWGFNLLYATGIWFIICLLKNIFSK